MSVDSIRERYIEMEVAAAAKGIVAPPPSWRDVGILLRALDKATECHKSGDSISGHINDLLSGVPAAIYNDPWVVDARKALVEAHSRINAERPDSGRGFEADLVKRLIYARKLAEEARALLDDDKDIKCLKLLGAMAGRTGYRADVDATWDLQLPAPEVNERNNGFVSPACQGPWKSCEDAGLPHIRARGDECCLKCGDPPPRGRDGNG